MKEKLRPFSDFEHGRLKAYAHILTVKHHAEQAEANERHLRFSWLVNGKEEQVLFRQDHSFIEKLDKMADEIYTSDLSKRPHLKHVADGIRNSILPPSTRLEPEKEARLARLLGDERAKP